MTNWDCSAGMLIIPQLHFRVGTIVVTSRIWFVRSDERDHLFATWSANMTTQSPAKLIAQAAAITLAQPTFHLSIQNERGKTTVFPGVQLQGVEGAVQQPDRFRAKAKAKAVFVTVEIQVIGIGGRLWVANPIQGAKNFKERSVDAKYLPLTRPDNIVQLLLKLLEEPRIDRTEKNGNQVETVIAGRLQSEAPWRGRAGTDVQSDQNRSSAAGGDLDRRQFDHSSPQNLRPDGDV